MPMLSRLLHQFLMLFGGLLISGASFAAQEVRVAAAYFPPYVYKPDHDYAEGLQAGLLTVLNESQTEFRFVAVPTSLMRRFRDLEQGRTDMSLFENPLWGWSNFANHQIDMGLVDTEVFVARKEPGRTQAYFDRLDGKRLVLFAAYHYRFADYRIEPAFLSSEFNAVLGHSHESNLLMLLHGRADIAPMTRSFIESYIMRNPRYSDRVMISERVDQVYRHQAILREGAPITPEQFTTIYEALRDSGKLQNIFGNYGITVLPRSAMTR
ncbi:transporter substrate-binding domain-containing protein [Ectopseudomonas mendocina]|uniref:Transporter substrate-binding domain-containing protein n=1 Tax=Ectopseudomonas mendocina TaxID=300 RepID=A0ABZ2RFY1_ECTME